MIADLPVEVRAEGASVGPGARCAPMWGALGIPCAWWFIDARGRGTLLGRGRKDHLLSYGARCEG